MVGCGKVFFLEWWFVGRLLEESGKSIRGRGEIIPENTAFVSLLSSGSVS